MLVRLDQEQISRYWGVVGPSIHTSMGRPNQEVMENILKALYAGKLQCWAYIEGESKLVGVVTTMIMDDDVSLIRKLLIYSMNGFTNVKATQWKDGLEKLIEFAKQNQCNVITAYTINSKVVSLVKKLGGAMEYFIYIGVPNENI